MQNKENLLYQINYQTRAKIENQKLNSKRCVLILGIK